MNNVTKAVRNVAAVEYRRFINGPPSNFKFETQPYLRNPIQNQTWALVKRSLSEQVQEEVE